VDTILDKYQTVPRCRQDHEMIKREQSQTQHRLQPTSATNRDLVLICQQQQQRRRRREPEHRHYIVNYSCTTVRVCFHIRLSSYRSGCCRTVGVRL